MNKEFSPIDYLLNSTSQSKESISSYIEQIKANIQEYSQNQNFYKLPFNLINSIIDQIDFSCMENSKDVIENIIKNTIKEKEENSFLLFSSIHLKNCLFSLETCIELLKYFTNSDLCMCIYNLFQEKQSKEKEINEKTFEKDKEIQEIQNKMKSEEKDDLPYIYQTDIWKAATDSDLISLRYLITEKNMNVDSLDTFKMTPLHYATISGNLSIVQYLIEEKSANKDAKDKKGYTPLLYASIYDRLSLVKYFLETQKVDKNAKDFKYSRNALHFACNDCYLDIIEYLIEEQGFDKELPDNIGMRPIHFACKRGSLEVVKYLIEMQFVDNNPGDEYGRTPIHYACENGFLSIVKYLVNEQNVDIETKDKLLRTPLHFAAMNNQLDIVKFLLSKGANPKIKNQVGDMPINVTNSNDIKKLIKKVLLPKKSTTH